MFLMKSHNTVVHLLFLLGLLLHRGAATIRTSPSTPWRRVCAAAFVSPALGARRRQSPNPPPFIIGLIGTTTPKPPTWSARPPPPPLGRCSRRSGSSSALHQQEQSQTTVDATASSGNNTTTSSSSGQNVVKMRVAEIQTILKQWKVDYSDCFDKESLVQRYQEAAASRNDGDDDDVVAGTQDEVVPPQKSSTGTDKEHDRSATPNAPGQDENDDLLSLTNRLRQMSVKELRQEMARKNLRWAGMLEKQDLVRALVDAQRRARQFSVTGLVSPGQVANLNATQIQMELGITTTSGSKSRTVVSTPLLVDVFATWCGPCQLLQGQLQEVAAQLQDRIRIVKMDSDQNPTLASQWRVQGLPTLILFDENGQEMDRIEGALMKDQLIQWIESKI